MSKFQSIDLILFFVFANGLLDINFLFQRDATTPKAEEGVDYSEEDDDDYSYEDEDEEAYSDEDYNYDEVKNLFHNFPMTRSTSFASSYSTWE